MLLDPLNRGFSHEYLAWDIKLDYLKEHTTTTESSEWKKLWEKAFAIGLSNSFVNSTGHLVTDVTYTYQTIDPKQYWVFFEGSYSTKVIYPIPDSDTYCALHITVSVGDIDTQRSTLTDYKLLAWIKAGVGCKKDIILVGGGYDLKIPFNELAYRAVEQYLGPNHETGTRFDPQLMKELIQKVKTEGFK